MEKMIIEGGYRLVGEVPISGAKNAALPLFAASLLVEDWLTLHNVPALVVIREHLGYWNTLMAAHETQKHPLIPFACDVYEKHVENLGLVDRKVVGLVVKFYGYVHFVNALQETQDQDWKLHGNHPDSFDNKYKHSLERLVNDFEKAFDKAFKAYGLM